MRKTFLVGRVSSRGEEILVIEDRRPPHFPGPWVLKAVLRSSLVRPSRLQGSTRVVH